MTNGTSFCRSMEHEQDKSRMVFPINFCTKPPTFKPLVCLFWQKKGVGPIVTNTVPC